jgi:hypothetical protein
VEEDMKARKEQLSLLSDESEALSVKEGSVATAYTSKKKAHAAECREAAKRDKRHHKTVAEIDEREPLGLQLRQQAAHTKRKVKEDRIKVAALAAQQEERNAEARELQREIGELEGAREALDAATKEKELVFEGARLEEYHAIKEKALTQTTKQRNDLASILREQEADGVRIQALQQDMAEAQTELAVCFLYR